jgi:queuine tRNA-ribosyltransferase
VSFRVVASCAATRARAGLLTTAHGELPTPAFMPVGTLATVKGLTPLDLRASGAHCVLANAYHLAQQPGAELIARLGGLHRFMGWAGPILTDSGGFQVYSLSRIRQMDDVGVRFRSDLSPEPIELTPESAVREQELLDSDIIMPLDVCLGLDAGDDDVQLGLERTRRWARRSLEAHRRSDQLLFGIVQGGLQAKLRREAARDLCSFGFAGYAMGGLSVGEPLRTTRHLVQATAAALPEQRPRYLMGVGTPEQILDYVALGVDMFDCVLPTRFGRTGTAFGPEGRLNLRRAEFARDKRPIDGSCDCAACRCYTRAFLHSAVRSVSGGLGARLLSLHNTRALIRTAEKSRSAILAGRFPRLVGAPLPPTVRCGSSSILAIA